MSLVKSVLQQDQIFDRVSVIYKEAWASKFSLVVCSYWSASCRNVSSIFMFFCQAFIINYCSQLLCNTQQPFFCCCHSILSNFVICSILGQFLH